MHQLGVGGGWTWHGREFEEERYAEISTGQFLWGRLFFLSLGRRKWERILKNEFVADDNIYEMGLSVCLSIFSSRKRK